MVVFSFSIQGETFNLSCRNSDDFIMSFKVDTNQETITHTTSSVSPNSSSTNKGQTFRVFKDLTILRWSYPYVWVISENSYEDDQDNYDFRYFDFVNNKMRFTTLEDVKKRGNIGSYPVYYDCFET